MPRYMIMTGPYQGEIVDEGQVFITGTPFSELDADMRLRVWEWAKIKYPSTEKGYKFPVSLNQLVDDYETSWESVEVCK